ncbi:GNAT family N-acetyltransferase [Rhizobium wenxiniae]|uniref:GNAT family N-acetyltransferase n=1 Tax=Rhizobium wenxiniae TaxID=1737357 RepID=UPI001CB796C0|nr:GNAT family N-acetyltransferase [Rhizobium wenxiniae]
MLAKADFSITVRQEALPPFEGPNLVNVQCVAPYEKKYPCDEALFEEAMASKRMIATANLSGDTLGYVAVSQAWNQCAEINDIMISRAYRGAGLGRALMDEAVSWAKENGLAIVRLETQTSNVSACRFYERYGFKLGGYDRHLYDALRQSDRSETALFWYLHLH